MADLQVKAGDTEPIGYTIGLTADSELATSDISDAVLYARPVGGTTNHVDGASVTVDSVSTSQNSDGSWDHTFDLTFDPENNGPNGNNAFDTGDEGRYAVYTKVTWSDSDETRHPNDDNRTWAVAQNFEG